jgi:hypothetical protein
MAGGNKKNKRGSIPSQSSSVSPITELIVRTPENDYGVLSDPDEQPNDHTLSSTSPSTSHYEEYQHDEAQDGLPVSVLSVIPECSDIPDDRSPTLQPSPDSSSLLQGQHLMIQQPSNKSLETLKVKLMRDKNFSSKMTLHTFFSYIILAMEIQRSCSASIAKLSTESVQELVIYMIEHHSSNDTVRSYLQGLVDTGIVKHMIDSIIDFNNDNKNSSIFSIEESELQLLLLQETNNNTAAATATAATAAAATATDTTDTATDTATDTEMIVVTDTSSDSQSDDISSQTPQKCGSFKRMMRCFFSGCCG